MENFKRPTIDLCFCLGYHATGMEERSGSDKLFRSSDDGALDKDSIKSTQKPYFGIEIAEISKTSNQENCCLIANTTFKKK